jgi:hypothetical protein
MNLRAVVLMAIATTVALPAGAAAVVGTADREALRGVPDRWGFGLGGFWQTFDAKFRLDGEAGRGTDINLQQDFNLRRKSTSPAFGCFYRFSDRSRLDLTYVPWSRKRTRTINRQIVWGDVTYEAGASVTATAKTEMLNVIYRYSFLNNGRVTFGLDAGISSLWSDFSLSGEGTISGGTDVAGTIKERKKVILPAPVIGMHLEVTLIKRLFWRLEDNFFAASISGYAGNVNELSTSFIYFPAKHFGMGAGFVSAKYTVEKSGSRGGDFRLRYGFSGATAYLQFLF